MTLAGQPPPDPPNSGWYPDPLGSGHLRYFDGQAWTSYIHAQDVESQGAGQGWRFKLGWRKLMTAAFVIWSVPFAVLIAALILIPEDPGAECAHQISCVEVPSGPVVALLFFAWLSSFLVYFLIYFLIWFMTRPRPRVCPGCGVHVPKGAVACPFCRQDFAAAGPAPSQGVGRRRRFSPGWRKMTWALVVWSGFFLAILAIGALASATEADELGSNIEAMVGIFIIWFPGFLVLSSIWLMTDSRPRICAACGAGVRKGPVACPSCRPAVSR